MDRFNNVAEDFSNWKIPFTSPLLAVLGVGPTACLRADAHAPTSWTCWPGRSCRCSHASCTRPRSGSPTSASHWRRKMVMMKRSHPGIKMKAGNDFSVQSCYDAELKSREKTKKARYRIWDGSKIWKWEQDEKQKQIRWRRKYDRLNKYHLR